MSKRLPLIVGGAVVVLAAGYFGLSAYSGKQAQKHLEDWTYEHNLDDKLSWSTVSASPLGGSVSIAGLELDLGSGQDALRAEQVTISEVIDEERQTRVRLQFKGVAADNAAFANLRGLGAMAGGSLTPNLGYAARGFEPALNSGLTHSKPFDLELFVDIDDDDGILETELALSLPDLFDSRISYRLNNQRDLNRQLRRLQDDLADSDNALRALGKLKELSASLERAEIESLQVSLKDRGMLARSIALQQRYNTPLDPAAGSADDQRAKFHARHVEQIVKDCEKGQLAKVFGNGCELLGEVLMGEESGVELSVKPTESVRIQDLAKLENERASKRLLERLNPQLSSI
ncbi:YdgA family protein [Metapseudomonas furukawaii]|uniref:hypothetical protein n=1 Tax=Metapseudomonas furukawaii TaxID=1149133 RepID=UPI00227CE5FF|nr:hypothetical protein [Pseudomonas furukawaii]WAG79582.1 YdgA family protein [Pseudomonas furukawaii]